MKKPHVYLLAGLLATAGLTLAVYKVTALDFPLRPGARTYLWSIEAHLTFKGGGAPVKIGLRIPRTSERLSIIDENFVARGYGVNVATEDGVRRATWTIRKASGTQRLYYKATALRMDRGVAGHKPPHGPPLQPQLDDAQLEAARAVLAEVRETSADTDSLAVGLLQRLARRPADHNLLLLMGKQANLEKKVETAVGLLALEGVHARAVHGIVLEDQRRNAAVTHWIDIYDNGQWTAYDPSLATHGIPDNYLAWWQGSAPLIQSQGVKNLKVAFSVVRSEETALQMAAEKGLLKKPFLMEFSLLNLPAQTQAVYRVVLVVPFGVLFLVLLRNVIGIRTFGTFMPVLIALAFRETQLLWGVFLFTFLVGIGLLIRLYLEHLKLLVVPRLAAILIVVIGTMAFLSMLTNQLGFQRGLSVALFPMVVLSMTIERMSIVWDELGPLATLKQGFGSMLAAIACYLIMSATYIEHLAFVFPETLLILLAAALLLGRYSGYRLMELRRFKALTDVNDHV